MSQLAFSFLYFEDMYFLHLFLQANAMFHSNSLSLNPETSNIYYIATKENNVCIPFNRKMMYYDTFMLLRKYMQYDQA